MSTIDTGKARERLEEEQSRLEDELRRLREDTTRSLEDATDEDGIDTHMADSATETHDRELEISLEDTLERRLGEVRAAFGRLDDGTYGQCARCGRPIPAERLEAMPSARFDVDCQRLEELG